MADRLLDGLHPLTGTGVLNPLRSEGEAFRLLVYVLIVFVVIVAAILIVRAVI